ncbi:SIMPL domain-containing protein [Candidatus Gracilibacteria bacterium]|nr:SIMPL domain-containing protein [Candidatus Gracilibacteria bacterium]MCF7819617.1 SIMPL domain-containing protein [Candidatus Gracilibacteria bacterium]
MKNKFFDSPLVGMATILGIALLLCTLIGTYTVYRVKSLGNQVSVTGSAEMLITSDTAKWINTLSLDVGVEELAQGTETLRKQGESVQNYLIEKGVLAEEITAAPLQITENCNHRDNVVWTENGQKCTSGNIAGYTLTSQITIESPKVQLITTLAKNVPEHFLFQDILFTTKALEYYYSKLDDLKLEMLEKATENAKDRAQRIAESTGAKVGHLQSASVGVFQIIQPNSTDFADYGRYDTSTIEKKIVSVVRAEFSLK